MLYMTKVKLELIPDPDMYIFFEKGSRDGFSYISNRYSKTNNKYLKSYDPKRELKHMIYLDTYTRIIYMVMQCLSFLQQVDSNG